MHVYRCLKDKRKLALICDGLDKYELNHCEEYFYTVRALDRNKESFDKLKDYVKALRTIYLKKLIDDRRIKATKISKHILISEYDFLKFMEQMEVKTNDR